jgi:putative Mg2+ transporter-C (MgtC) family protein
MSMFPLREFVLRLGVAALLGAAIGVERDFHRRPAGVRTSAFVCFGSALFTMLSFELAHRYGDSSSTRIVSNLVQGIGFLGAGAILREAGGIVGLTTAATIFVEAAIGMAAGGGLYSVAGYSTGLVLFALVVLGLITKRTGLKPRVLAVRVTTTQTENIFAEIQELVHGLKITLDHVRVSMEGAKSIVEFQADIKPDQERQLLQKFARPGVVTEIIPVQGQIE